MGPGCVSFITGTTFFCKAHYAESLRCEGQRGLLNSRGFSNEQLGKGGQRREKKPSHNTIHLFTEYQTH